MADAGPWRRFVALGDSFTEGMCDPGAGDHPWRGWADRLAEALAVAAAGTGGTVEYANLAIRGRLLPQIVAEQVPPALAMRPDLVSIIGGGNDILRPGADPDGLAELLDGAVGRLTAAGATVLMGTGYDPRFGAPLVRRTRGTVAVFNANVWTVAQRHGALVLDLWGMAAALHDRRIWAEDRIHLTAEGHRRVAAFAVHLLGLDTARDWAEPLPPLPPRTRQEAWRQDALWVRGYVVPWVARRLRGQSSGDGLPPKRPHPVPVTPAPS